MQVNPFAPGALSTELSPAASVQVGNAPFNEFWLLTMILLALDSISKGQAAATPTTYTPHYSRPTADGQIPSGALSWSITAISGTVTIGGATLDNGASVSGGGNGRLATAIEYTITGGAALVYYET